MNFFGRRQIKEAALPPLPTAAAPSRPLREFVYLDEVSLRSLLSSQKGEVTDATSEQVGNALEAEIGAKLAAQAPLLGSAELNSRFQTSNSSTLQTSRKATVQSWFRDFHNLQGLRLVEPSASVKAAVDLEELLGNTDKSVLIAASDFGRGELVEYRVRLSADQIFHLGTMVTEFTDLVNDSPGFFESHVTSQMGEMLSVNKILQRLLAGLIPIRALAIDYEVVTIDSVEYVAHRDALAGLDLERRSLEIVGVTEHLAYWKDIRRVLFSEAEFTMLCRVSRFGLQSSWTPVKLAELFKAVAPDMVDQINNASRDPFSKTGNTSVKIDDLKLQRALTDYKDGLVAAAELDLDSDQVALVTNWISELRDHGRTAALQYRAFVEVHNLISSMTAIRLDANRDLALREAARAANDLPLFPTLSSGGTITVAGDEAPQRDVLDARLLDVEVVAIYW